VHWYGLVGVLGAEYVWTLGLCSYVCERKEGWGGTVVEGLVGHKRLLGWRHCFCRPGWSVWWWSRGRFIGSQHLNRHLHLHGRCSSQWEVMAGLPSLKPTTSTKTTHQHPPIPPHSQVLRPRSAASSTPSMKPSTECWRCCSQQQHEQQQQRPCHSSSSSNSLAAAAPPPTPPAAAAASVATWQA